MTLSRIASDPALSRGRFHQEPESRNRTPFQRDRDRIVHSTAFRRLQYKTQVFVFHEGDYYRTRLTHSLEVAQIARSVSRALGLNEDLAETLALAHDLGHPPFGHAGEDALHACMQPYEGFDHNAQSLKIVAALEQRYGAFDGLNLTWETLEGIVKHNGPLIAEAGKGVEKLPHAIRTYVDDHDLEIHTYAGPEAQVAALADDIAYNNHDIDDGLRAGLFTLDDLAALPFVGDVIREVKLAYPDAAPQRQAHETVRRLIDRMVRDLMDESQKRIAAAGVETAQDVRVAAKPVMAFSDDLLSADKELRTFLMDNMYRHYRVNRMTSKARRIVTDLFELYMNEQEILPDDWRDKCQGVDDNIAARHICDFIAGMTDRYAIEEHRRLFDLTI